MVRTCTIHTRTRVRGMRFPRVWDWLHVDDKPSNFHLIWDFEFCIFPSTAGCFEAARGGNLLIVDYHSVHNSLYVSIIWTRVTLSL